MKQIKTKVLKWRISGPVRSKIVYGENLRQAITEFFGPYTDKVWLYWVLVPEDPKSVTIDFGKERDFKAFSLVVYYGPAPDKFWHLIVRCLSDKNYEPPALLKNNRADKVDF